jgi:hypothetical protein
MDEDYYFSNTKTNSSFVAWSLVGILSFLLLFAVSIIIYLLNGNGGQKEMKEEKADYNQLNSFNLPSPIHIPTIAISKNQILNKEFNFPIQNSKGERLAEIGYLIKSFERSEEVEIAGGEVKTIKGKELLIVYVELTNKLSQAIQIMAGDYIRLSVNGEEKWSAPEFNSDPVEVRAKSDKSIRMAFTVNQSDTNLRLQVGEIDGAKEIIQLDRSPQVEESQTATQSSIQLIEE